MHHRLRSLLFTVCTVCAHIIYVKLICPLPQHHFSFPFSFSFSFWCHGRRISVFLSNNNGLSLPRLSILPIYFTQSHGIMNTLCRHRGKVHLKPSHFFPKTYFRAVDALHTHTQYSSNGGIAKYGRIKMTRKRESECVHE